MAALWPRVLQLEMAVFLLGLGYYAWFLLAPGRFIAAPLANAGILYADAQRRAKQHGVPLARFQPSETGGGQRYGWQ